MFTVMHGDAYSYNEYDYQTKEEAQEKARQYGDKGFTMIYDGKSWEDADGNKCL